MNQASRPTSSRYSSDTGNRWVNITPPTRLDSAGRGMHSPIVLLAEPGPLRRRLRVRRVVYALLIVALVGGLSAFALNSADLLPIVQAAARVITATTAIVGIAVFAHMASSSR